MTDAIIEKRNRMREAIDHLGIKRHRLAPSLGYKKKYFDQMLGNAAQRNVSDAVILKFTKKYPQYNPDWIMFGKGEMLLTDNHETQPSQDPSFYYGGMLYFGANLTLIRISVKQSIEQFAPRLKIDTETLISLERGGRAPWLGLLLQIREETGIGIDDFMFLDLSQVDMKKLKEKTAVLEAYQAQQKENKQIRELMEGLSKQMEALKQEVEKIKKQ